MANSSISTGNVVTRFQKEVRREFVREGRFGSMIGDTENSVIQTNKNLKKVSIPLVAKLGGPGVVGSGQLTGNEEPLSNFDAVLQPRHFRNGVLIDNEENEKAEFDLFRESRPALMKWLMEKKRDQMIQGFGAIEAGGTYFNYGGGENTGATGSSAASAANMDTWNTNNQDRILYGQAKSNLTAGDHTTSLATIDTVNDKVDTDMITLLKRLAADADPLITPINITNDEEMYIFMVGKFAFRDFREDPVVRQANREAMPRSKDNPLFVGGDLMWDNVIIKEIKDLDKFIDSTGSNEFDGLWGANAVGDDLRTAGNGGSRVSMGWFVGAQALGFGIGKMARFDRRKEDDYGHLNGVGITAKHDIKKLFYNNKQHGMITSFHSASLDV